MKGKKKIKISKLEEEKITGGILKKEEIVKESRYIAVAYGGPGYFNQQFRKIESSKKLNSEKENSIMEDFSEEKEGKNS